MKASTILAGSAIAIVAIASAVAQSLDPAKVTQPDGVQLAEGDQQELLAHGKQLFADPSIGESGLSCTNCHQNFGQYKETFEKPYPHFVQMAKGKAGLDEVNAAEMVQLCMVVPMQTEPLPWESKELAALTAYVKDERQRFADRNN